MKETEKVKIVDSLLHLSEKKRIGGARIPFQRKEKKYSGVCFFFLLLVLEHKKRRDLEHQEVRFLSVTNMHSFAS